MRGIEYAKAGDTHVAYCVVEGAGDHEIVMVSGAMFPMESLFDDPQSARLLDGLAALGRLVLFDRRGIGQSDPVTDWERRLVEQWADDLGAVISAATSAPPVVFAWDAFGVARELAARDSHLLGRLVLFNPASFRRGERLDDQALVIDGEDIARNIAGEDDSVIYSTFPSRVGDPSFMAWLERAGRTGASPATATRMWTALFAEGARTPPGIAVPTLVLHRPDSAAVPLRSADRVAGAITGATLVRLDGADEFPITGDVDAVLAEVSAFVTGVAVVPPPQRRLAAVLFTDIVASTERAARLGDEQWRSLLDRHDEVVRAAVARAGGSVVKTTGDGVLATFPSATQALRSATAILSGVAEHDLEVRVGVHVGEIDERGGDVSGIGVHVAARVMARAAAGEVLVSASVPIAAAGSGYSFESRGPAELKGVPGEWVLCALSTAT